MNNRIQNIEAISQQLTASTINLERKRCSYMRSWKSKCRRCLNICPHDAIKRTAGHLDIDSEACTDCAACAAVCPTSTFLPGAPSAAQIVQQAEMSAQRCGGSPCFACARLVEDKGLDTGRVCVLPCLNYLDEYLLVGLFGQDYERVAVLKPDCEGCPVGSNPPYFDQIVDNVKDLMGIWQVPGRLIVASKIPDELLTGGKPSAPVIASDRRGALNQVRASAFGAASDAITGFIEGRKPANPRVNVTSRDIYPPDSYKSVRLLNMLERIGTSPHGQELRTPFWGNVYIKTEKCHVCGNCADVCPTRAFEFSKEDDGTATLTFSPRLCMGCELCKNMCLSHAIVYDRRIMADTLLADEPQVLYENATPPKKTNAHKDKGKLPTDDADDADTASAGTDGAGASAASEDAEPTETP
ncbi:MAG: 4Fe-4S dicluster domain-containing protein [Coriobacteriaceae bacterium]|nr:4Fe-4S dicluster domain-containing protein [Coriobacteriaceae bacterium]